MATAGAKGEGSASATYARAVKTGVPRAHGGSSNRALIQIPFFFYSGNSWTGEVKCNLVITSVNPKDCQFSSQKLYVWSMWSHQSLIVLLLRPHEKEREVPCMAKSRIPGRSHSCSVSLIL
ncbi:hypothetical protein NC651_032229 [Populus alba x Populus x berolinensis]|nr:hypothetical protein NC651_032187 [Populus alba x Populus x berolinensis]KAJ6873287.1 hypothetical protein NC651_032229 [Populus alba x Populus x berolinensis]